MTERDPTSTPAVAGGLPFDATQIQFTQSGTGAVARTVQSKERDIVSVRDFGALGDGVTDDTAAIQAAINSFSAGGGTLIAPAGNYLFSSTILFNKEIRLVGASRENTATARFLKKSTLNGDGFRIVSGFNHVSIENIALTGQPGNGGDGISVQGGFSVLRNVTVNAMGNDGIRHGTDAAGTNANSWTMENVESLSNTRRGFYLHSGDNNANAGVATRCFAGSNGEDGIRLGNVGLNTFIGCTSEANTGIGINIKAPAVDNFFFGGDSEANTGGNYSREAGSTRNIIMLPGSTGSFGIGTRAFHSANQSIADVTTTTLAFDSERWDTDDCHDLVTNNSRLTCNTRGKYLITANIAFASNATGRRYCQIRLNGATIIAVDTKPAVNGDQTCFSISTMYDMAAADYIECRVFQNSGGALNIETSANYSPEFSMIRQN